jgi:predicted PurR-regulated permease PerM
MARLMSLIVLAVLIAVIGMLSFEVLSAFILPLFLAGMTAVLFKPLQEWLTRRCRGHERIAAGLTTLLLALGVLLPSAALGLMAASEAAELVKSMDRESLAKKFSALQNRLSLGPPPAAATQALDQLRQTLDRLDALPTEPPPTDERPLFESLQTESAKIEAALGLPPSPDAPLPPVADDKAAPAKQLVAAWLAWKAEIAKTKPQPTDAAAWKSAWNEARAAINQFNGDLFGGPIAAWFKQNINVEPDQLQAVIDRVRSSLGPLALGASQMLVNFFVQFTLGAGILLLCVYYFLADGREMINSTMNLTPLDRTYVQQLVQEFANLTRAIVMSMLLSSVAQGLLAFPAYYFFGLGSVFLLTLATMVFAMVPFVGATIIWGSCAAWLFLVDGRTGAAIGMVAYGGLVISMADNLIKPLVLHGRSNLHPLPALLSVIGGVEALGPIGVFVGPMVVALLHTLLVMLRSELNRLDKEKKPTTPPLAT